MLHIPGLYTVAFWLADLVGWQDLLVPLAPAPPGVQPLRPYPAAELAHTLVARGATCSPRPRPDPPRSPRAPLAQPSYSPRAAFA
ncbi:hypothetical protein ACU686_41220 [Yinghuangia aomiensis]